MHREHHGGPTAAFTRSARALVGGAGRRPSVAAHRSVPEGHGDVSRPTTLRVGGEDGVPARGGGRSARPFKRTCRCNTFDAFLRRHTPTVHCSAAFDATGVSAEGDHRTSCATDPGVEEQLCAPDRDHQRPPGGIRQHAHRQRLRGGRQHDLQEVAQPLGRRLRIARRTARVSVADVRGSRHRWPSIRRRTVTAVP